MMPSDHTPAPANRERTNACAAVPKCQEISPGIQRSQEAFRRDLPQLLRNQKRYRQWVAYHGDNCIGFGTTDTELYEACLRRGLTEEDFVVRCIVPEVPSDRDATPLGDVST